jgi:hypothetical protein
MSPGGSPLVGSNLFSRLFCVLLSGISSFWGASTNLQLRSLKETIRIVEQSAEQCDRPID